MSNIVVDNMKNGLNCKVFKVFSMSQKDFVGTYDFIASQKVNYEKKIFGRNYKRVITIISNADGNYIDYVKGKRKDQVNLSYGKRCVYIKDNVLVTGEGVDSIIVLLLLKTKIVLKLFFIIFILMIILTIMHFIVIKNI